MKQETKAKIILTTVFIALCLICAFLVSLVYLMNDNRKIINSVHASFSETYVVATSLVITPERIYQNDDLLGYCLWDESRNDMSKIGLQGEIGALQYKQKTWDWFEEKYKFKGNIYSLEDQIDLFNIAVAGGDGYHWTCWLKYYGLLK